MPKYKLNHIFTEIFTEDSEEEAIKRFRKIKEDYLSMDDIESFSLELEEIPEKERFIIGYHKESDQL
jgi:tetrahydromethanopterin S-methyltransferase subunit A